ncbi:MAG: YraN family protein [Bacteroidales bacterium]|jgi:putative endonuclease|nr:YraN family protein [Bacteroidales bacterium]
MLTEKQNTGNQGEQLAQSYLEQHHYTILETNWRFGHLEIDIIAKDQEHIVFCEVKTRNSVAFGTPETFVNPQKQKNMIRAAHFYVVTKRIMQEVRFDIFSIVLGEKTEIVHIQDAFQPRW